ncbi:MAG: DUF2334 domain-containing protein [Armatimonadetes bacterium]|nr:DUF2334 domain-containing protein [Armatimonadota bacterium]
MNRRVALATTGLGLLGLHRLLAEGDAGAGPVVVLKLDDVTVRSAKGSVNARWQKVCEYLEQEDLRAGCGIICNSLEYDNPDYVAWIKGIAERGKIEFWFHGWDHAVHEVDGEKFNEFSHRTYEDQKERFEKSIRLAREKLGITLTCFGPGGGVGTPSYDAVTARVMGEVPEMTAWLYPMPIEKIGAELAKGGRVTILDRVWAANIEKSVGVPDLAKLEAGLAANPKRPYFVLQGHPAMWDDARFDEFKRICDFLRAKKCRFEQPTACAKWVAAGAR